MQTGQGFSALGGSPSLKNVAGFAATISHESCNTVSEQLEGAGIKVGSPKKDASHRRERPVHGRSEPCLLGKSQNSKSATVMRCPSILNLGICNLSESLKGQAQNEECACRCIKVVDKPASSIDPSRGVSRT